MRQGWLGGYKYFVAPSLILRNRFNVGSALKQLVKRHSIKLGNAEREIAGRMVKTVLMEQSAAKTKGSFTQKLLASPTLFNSFVDYVFTNSRDLQVAVSLVVEPHLDDYLSSAQQREWAFLRHERLDLNLAQPMLRGPVNAESLAPLSSLTTESSKQSESEIQSSLYEGLVKRSGGSSGLSASGHLEGLLEQSFHQDAEYEGSDLLLSSLSESRRNRIDDLLNEISTTNQSQSSSRQRTTNTMSRSYTTQGQDLDNAVTELSFQVVSRVQAKVWLEDVSLAWCPRLSHPFADLADIIRTAGDQAADEYLQENRVFMPLQPERDFDNAIVDETSTVSVDDIPPGSLHHFQIELGEEFLNWELDKDRTQIQPHCVYFGGLAGIREQTLDFALPVVEAVKRDLTLELTVSVSQAFYDAAKLSGWILWLVELRAQLVLYRHTDASRAAQANWESHNHQALQETEAVKARSKQYGRMRRNEMIAAYDNPDRIKEIVFSHLIQRMFPSDTWSYQRELVKSTLDWSRVQLVLEPAQMRPARLKFIALPPDHILNAEAVRLMLPIRKEAEKGFFDIMATAISENIREPAESVGKFVDAYRKYVDEKRNSDGETTILLDEYRSEMVIGRHAEAVLSGSSFSD
ncbi:MAG: hypothetical protein ABW166_07885 [Sedimenticola sp.]